jgi:hypothetical protein
MPPWEGVWTDDGSAAAVINAPMPVGKAEIAITLDFRRLCCAGRAREQRIEFDATARLGQREMSNRFDREVVKTAVIRCALRQSMSQQ